MRPLTKAQLTMLRDVAAHGDAYRTARTKAGKLKRSWVQFGRTLGKLYDLGLVTSNNYALGHLLTDAGRAALQGAP